MKNKKRVRVIFLLLYLAILCMDVQLVSYLNDKVTQKITLDETEFNESFRNQQIPLSITMKYLNTKERNKFPYIAIAYLVSESEEGSILEDTFAKMKRGELSLVQRYTSYETAVWMDAKNFPIPVSKENNKATVQFTDSWMQSRTYGGERGHEGCDIMADINERGYYPVLSMTDGVIEKIGWLSQGGYRIGVRAPSGGYFYYAHLYDYAEEFSVGETVQAGDLLGFMGDSGYSDVEGTVGNFPVHLHVGIYLNDKDGNEFSVNPYWVLRYLEDKKICYDY